jgi:hypothetical protein
VLTAESSKRERKNEVLLCVKSASPAVSTRRRYNLNWDGGDAPERQGCSVAHKNPSQALPPGPCTKKTPPKSRNPSKGLWHLHKVVAPACP